MLDRLLTLLGLGVNRPTPQDTDDTVDAVIRTSLGTIEVALFETDAPLTVAAFRDNAAYLDGKDGDGATIFHRVIAGFMVQCGGHRDDGSRKPPRPTVVSEANNGHFNVRGTLAMARTADPNSASTQWFINVVNNSSLDYGAFSAGYTVFGKVVRGMDVADAIAAVPTQGGDVPFEPIRVEDVTLI